MKFIDIAIYLFRIEYIFRFSISVLHHEYYEYNLIKIVAVSPQSFQNVQFDGYFVKDPLLYIKMEKNIRFICNSINTA